MKTYFTSDQHFNHVSTITRFIFRKFKDVLAMNRHLIKKWNEVVNDEDTVYVLGDFYFHNSKLDSIDYLLGHLNGNIIFIRGNHDLKKYAPIHILSAVLRFNKRNIYVRHDPGLIDDIYIQNEEIDFLLCGHVHEKWKAVFLMDNLGITKPLINVGVDVWNYTPVDLSTLINLKEKMIKEKYNYQIKRKEIK
jgi:calcineurin-like phosphoesterase family protein